MSRVEIKNFHPVTSRATELKDPVAHSNFQWPFDGQVIPAGKFEKLLSKWCKSRDIWHIFINVFTFLNQNIFGFSCLTKKRPVANWATGSYRVSEIQWPAHKNQWPYGHRAAA